MRYHRRARPCVLRHDPTRAAEIFRVEHLAVARLEPALSNREEAILDLVFERGGRFAVLPLAIVDSAFIIGRESSPFAWPASTKTFLNESTLRGLEAKVEPWLRSRLLARFENDEALKFYRDDESIRSSFARARDLKLFGAAPLGDVLASVAPAVYAYRFALGKRVAVPDDGFANAAALLYGRAARVDRDGDDFEEMWFGTQSFDAVDRSAAYDVALVRDASFGSSSVEICTSPAQSESMRVAFSRPLPLATFVSFDPDDSIAHGEFSVHVRTPAGTSRETSILQPAAIGGSAGRVALLVREDWMRADDADSDAIRTLERRLSAEGFTVRVIEGWSNVEPSEIDLAHLIGLSNASTIRKKVERLRDAGIPIVASPLVDDPKGETPWGVPLVQSAFRNSVEDTTLDHYLGAVALRRLNAEGVPLHQSLPLPANPDAVAVLNCAGALVVSGTAEEAIVRERFGYAGPVVAVAPLVPSVERCGVDAIAGIGDFILMHTAIEARTSVVMAALAAEAQGLPLVLVGPVADAETMLFLHAYGGDMLRYLPLNSLNDGQIEGLYARARVFADIPWNGRGLSRLARAGGYGASLVASTSGAAGAIWGDAIHLADPASLPSISDALRAAWDAAPKERGRVAARTALVCDQRSALAGSVQAYQEASAALAVI